MSNSFFYNTFFIPIGKILLKILASFSKKIKEREASVLDSHSSLNKLKENSQRLWFHSASMGEFEQAKPIIELIKKRNPSIEIVVSFFSPSGYKNQLRYRFADAIIYLPFDEKKAIENLYNKIRPKALIVVRYEIWRNLLEVGKSKNIPIFLVAATFPRSTLLTGLLGNFTRKNYNLINKIFSVNKENFDKFTDFGITSEIILSADPRFDRIISTIENLKNENFILKRAFWNIEDKVVVLGSSWQKDEEFFLELIKSPEFDKIKLVIVPHEPTEKHISELTKNLNNYILFSEIENLNEEEIKAKIKNKILIINKIGILLKLYSIADIAYVGGAFGVGVHSVTEPAGYGIPVLSGNGMTNSPDAVTMKLLGGLLTFSIQEELNNIISKLLEDKEYYQNCSKINYNYIHQNSGESEKIYTELQNHF